MMNNRIKQRKREQTFRGTVNVNGSHLLGCNLKNLKTHVKHVQIGFLFKACTKDFEGRKFRMCSNNTQIEKIAIAPLKAKL